MRVRELTHINAPFFFKPCISFFSEVKCKLQQETGGSLLGLTTPHYLPYMPVHNTQNCLPLGVGHCT